MSYCINPACSNPHNPDDASTCLACGSKLLLSQRYRILKPLGKGGFGATFLAQDLSLPGSPSCVVKQLRPTMTSRRVIDMAQQLFQREATTLGKIGNHPQVPRLLDYFVRQEQFYLVQEFIDGSTLKQEVRQAGPYNEEQTQTFLREVLPLLDYIHSQSVIHRDIKPANIIRRRQDNRLVLIDFGAVKDEVSQVSMMGTGETAFTNFAIGTSGFAPPEQMSLRPVYASDIYAVGMTCIYLLTGQSPNRLQSDPMTGQLLWQSEICVSDGLAEILQKMLELSVRQRYQSAQQVLAALDQLDQWEELHPIETQLDGSIETIFEGTLETEFKEDLSAGLAVQPTKSMVWEEGTDVDPEVPTIYTPDDTATPTSPFAAEAARIRARNARQNQKVAASSSGKKRDLSLEDGLTASRGMPITSVSHRLTQKSKTGNSRFTQASWDERSLRSAYIRGERYFTDCDLSDFNLEGTKFSGAYFSECQLTQANFQGADLSRTNFSRARLAYAVLRDANLRNAYLSTANLEGADLRGANLSGACLSRANLRGANLCGANLTKAIISDEQLALARTNWRTIKPDGKRGFGL